MEKTAHRPPKPLNFRTALPLVKNTFQEWMADKAPRLGAALSFYTLFSLAPLVIIFITIAGLAFDNAETQVLTQVSTLVGENGTEAIRSMIEAARKPTESVIATIFGFALLIFGAAGVFIQLKDALNTIWNVPPTSASGIGAFVKKYFLSFSMVLGIGFLLLVSLLLSAGLSMFGEYLVGYFPAVAAVMKIISFVVSFAIVSCLFAMLFKFLPDAKVSWRDVWLGAVLTAFLFVIGKFGLGIYLGRAGVASAYGAAGSLVLILLWVYYSAQILFFGAEFTQVYSKYHGSKSERERPRTGKRTRKDKLISKIEDEREEIAVMAKTFGMIKTPRHHLPKSRFDL